MISTRQKSMVLEILFFWIIFSLNLRAMDGNSICETKKSEKRDVFFEVRDREFNLGNRQLENTFGLRDDEDLDMFFKFEKCELLNNKYSKSLCEGEKSEGEKSEGEKNEGEIETKNIFSSDQNFLSKTNFCLHDGIYIINFCDNNFLELKNIHTGINEFSEKVDGNILKFGLSICFDDNFEGHNTSLFGLDSVLLFVENKFGKYVYLYCRPIGSKFGKLSNNILKMKIDKTVSFYKTCKYRDVNLLVLVYGCLAELWDVNTGKKIYSIQIDEKIDEKIKDSVVLYNGEFIFFSANNKVRLISNKEKKCFLEYDLGENVVSGKNCLKFFVFMSTVRDSCFVNFLWKNSCIDGKYDCIGGEWYIKKMELKDGSFFALRHSCQDPIFFNSCETKVCDAKVLDNQELYLWVKGKTKTEIKIYEISKKGFNKIFDQSLGSFLAGGCDAEIKDISIKAADSNAFLSKKKLNLLFSIKRGIFNLEEKKSKVEKKRFFRDFQNIYFDI